MKAGDACIIAICATLVGAVYWFAWQPAGAAHLAVLRVPGEPPRRIALDGSRELTVAGRRGESRVAVRPGGVRFLASPCSAKHCVHAGWLEEAGDFAACLPNGVSLTLAGGRNGYDGLGY